MTERVQLRCRIRMYSYGHGPDAAVFVGPDAVRYYATAPDFDTHQVRAGLDYDMDSLRASGWEFSESTTLDLGWPP